MKFQCISLKRKIRQLVTEGETLSAEAWIGQAPACIGSAYASELVRHGSAAKSHALLRELSLDSAPAHIDFCWQFARFDEMAISKMKKSVLISETQRAFIL